MRDLIYYKGLFSLEPLLSTYRSLSTANSATESIKLDISLKTHKRDLSECIRQKEARVVHDMDETAWEATPEKRSRPLSISQEVLRSVLYGKWCNVFGGQKELTFKSSALEKVDYNSGEGNFEPAALR